MFALAFLWAWSGYGVTTYGWCMVKGYEITAGQWFSPFAPYEWPPGGQPPLIPKGQVWPGGGGSGGSGDAGGSGGGGSSSGGTAPPPTNPLENGIKGIWHLIWG